MPTYQSDKTRVPCGVAAVIKDSLGRTLLIKRTGAHGEGKWSVPGGWVSENDLEIEAAVIREVWEEVGVKVYDHGDMYFLGATRDFHREGIHDVCLWYRIERYEGEPKNCNPDRISDLTWRDLGSVSHDRGEYFLPLQNALIQGVI